MPIDASAKIADGAQIHPGADIGPWCVIGENVSIGANTKLHGNVYVDGNTSIGEDNEIYPFAVLGTAPQHTGYRGVGTHLVIGARNAIREYVVIHRAIESHERITRIGDDNMFMLGTHIGHDGNIGSKVICAPHALLGGHVTVEDNVMIGGNVVVHQFSRIGKYAMVGGHFPARRDVIPFGLINSPEGNLGGLNIIGMKRQGMSRKTIANVQQAYKILFFQSETMEQGQKNLCENYADCEAVGEIIRFLQTPSMRHYARPAVAGGTAV